MEQGRNEKGVAKRNETGPPAKGEKEIVRIPLVSLVKPFTRRHRYMEKIYV